MSSKRTLKELSKPTNKNKIDINYHTSAFSNFTDPVTVSSITGFLILSLLVSLVLCKRRASSSLMNVENPQQSMYYPKMAERSGNNEDTDKRGNRESNMINLNTSPYEKIDFSSDESSDIMSSNSIRCQQECIFLSQSKEDLSEGIDGTDYLCPGHLNRKEKTDKDTNDDKYLTVI